MSQVDDERRRTLILGIASNSNEVTALRAMIAALKEAGGETFHNDWWRRTHRIARTPKEKFDSLRVLLLEKRIITHERRIHGKRQQRDFYKLAFVPFDYSWHEASQERKTTELTETEFSRLSQRERKQYMKKYIKKLIWQVDVALLTFLSFADAKVLMPGFDEIWVEELSRLVEKARQNFEMFYRADRDLAIEIWEEVMRELSPG